MRWMSLFLACQHLSSAKCLRVRIGAGSRFKWILCFLLIDSRRFRLHQRLRLLQIEATVLDNLIRDGDEVVVRDLPPERFMVLISVRGWFNPRATTLRKIRKLVALLLAEELKMPPGWPRVVTFMYDFRIDVSNWWKNLRGRGGVLDSRSWC
jgi:hypothetical protein